MWGRPTRRTPALIVVFGALQLAACGPPLGGSASGAPVPDPLQDAESRELFERGVALAQQGDLLRAEQYLASAIDRGYDEAEALPVLLRVCVASSRIASAIRYAEPYLAHHPDDWGLRYLVASLYLGVGDLDAARGHLDRILEARPGAAAPHYLMGVTLRRMAVDGESRRHLRRYLALAPEGEFADEVRGMLAEPELPVYEVAPPAASPPSNEAPADGSPTAASPGPHATEGGAPR